MKTDFKIFAANNYYKGATYYWDNIFTFVCYNVKVLTEKSQLHENTTSFKLLLQIYLTSRAHMLFCIQKQNNNKKLENI